MPWTKETPTLFLAWQNPKSRWWYPVGRLRRGALGYEFSYTEGMLAAREHGGMPAIIGFPDLNKLYESEVLFPFFQNRIMNRRRPELADYLKSLGLVDTDGPMLELATTEGVRGTDMFRLYPEPRPVLIDGVNWFQVSFLAHGARYASQSAQTCLRGLSVGACLELRHEPENEHDRNACALWYGEERLGYVPRYLSPTFTQLMAQGAELLVEVVRANAEPVPWTRALQCRVSAIWPEGLEVLGELHHGLVDAPRADGQANVASVD